jgi:two-component system sensor histidine kinase HydH
MVGGFYGTELDLEAVYRQKNAGWRVMTADGGPGTFEVYRRFAPREEPYGGFEGRDRGGSYVIFVGLDMAPVQAAQAQDTRNTIITASVLLLLGMAGIVSLLMALGYRSARVSLSRVKALSDSLIEHMPVGLAAVDPEGRIAVLNYTAEKLFARPAAEAIGKPAQDILPPACMEMMGGLVPERPIIEKEFECNLGDGQTVPLEVIAAVLKDDDGVVTGRIALFRDLSELQRLRREVERSQRLAAVGRLAAVVAHEIRNPLSSIKGFATYFRQRYASVPDDVKVADILIQEVERLNRVISELLAYSRPLSLNRTKTNLSELVRNTLGTIERQAQEKGVELRAELQADVPEALIDADRLTRVFLNLFLNALAAMDRGGVLSVAVARHDDKTLRATVSDTGAGIRREDQARVFEPYFTTKPSGTGLGLAIVQRIVEAHGGEIGLASEPGKGTEFTILLPADGE